MFERFTDRGRRVLVLALEEARLLRHDFIGTEHMLLGLIREGQGVAAKALESLGISLEAVREKVEETVGQPGHPPVGSPPFTPRAKKALEFSLREALDLGHNYIGTEHMLLGLVRDDEGGGAQILVSLGADLPRVREQVMRLLSGEQPGPGQAAPPIPGLRSRRGLRAEPPGEPPTCSTCGASLAQQGVWSMQTIPPADEGGAPRSFTIVYCRSCGTAIAVLPGDANP